MDPSAVPERIEVTGTTAGTRPRLGLTVVPVGLEFRVPNRVTPDTNNETLF
jgi:hypothetical protein